MIITYHNIRYKYIDYGEKYQEVLCEFDFIQAKQRYQISASDIVRAKFDYIFKLKVLEFYFGLKL